jgi:hypothetical protein
LLLGEGVSFLPDGRVDMETCGMSDARLREALDARLSDRFADVGADGDL